MPYQEPTVEEITGINLEWGAVCRRYSHLISAKNIHLHSEAWETEAKKVCDELKSFANYWECIRHADGSELQQFAIEARKKLKRMLITVWAWKYKTHNGE